MPRGHNSRISTLIFYNGREVKREEKIHTLSSNEAGEINHLLGLMENEKTVHWFYMNNPFHLIKTPLATNADMGTGE